MKIILFIVSLIILFTGCVPKVNKIDKIKNIKIQKELLQDLNNFSSNDIQLKEKWWENFQDKQLNNLIQYAIKNAPSLKQLESRYKIATNLIRSNQSKNVPNVNFGSNISRQRYSENYIFPAPLGGSYNNLYEAGLELDYTFDFWDERASLIKASKSEALAQKALIKVKELAITTSISKLYISWDFKIQKIQRLRTLKKLVYEKHSILKKLLKLGLENEKKVNESNYIIQKLNQNILNIEEEIQNTKSSIAVIAGLLPSKIKELKVPNISKKYKLFIPKNIHLDVISHLPQIAVQKYLLASKDAYITNAKAKFYPNISLSGLIGFTSFPWSKLFKSTSFSPSAGVALSLPIFDANRREINLNTKLNDYNSQVYAYNQSIIKAVNEIVKTLKLIQLNKSDIKEEQIIIFNKNKNKNIEKKIFNLGLKNKISYINSNIDVIKESLNNLTLKNRQLQLQIDLIKSLGGGYKNKVENNVASNK
ncbi:hypothetical protein CPU12_06280 [Malaciobacter molluscorum LMG 25693]|uniref:Fusaric acid resistance efflux pump, outer membrane protein n=1 Tax=Malaciobacter molluscorum LMG 25693 TaxID=870501 RepID=A0A2G1DIT0_9BACT|nr:TolC family protein [Malaciobacter molluscorum]AXX91922.1 putative fusaric acid resistance efflux pump, outer membrane protein [Malaciobacter molluscorum LMG 25693]PHO18324.1 hypothetical protein CPU12_06280 [Malaciobacter molluscorum LMG 25693]